MSLVLVKLGGALLTDKAGHEAVRPGAIAAAASAISAADRALRLGSGGSARARLVVAHGSGSFAHVAAAATGMIEHPTPMATARVAAAARRLNAIVVDALIAEGLPALGLPGAAIVQTVSEDRCVVRADVVAAVLAAGLLPVVYGDAVPHLAGSGAICSTEMLLAAIARSLGAAKVVLATDVDGVYPPGGTGAPIALITPSDAEMLDGTLGAAAAGTTDVTGGMAGKVRIMAKLVGELPSVEVWIVNGARPGLLLEALIGEPSVGTRIAVATGYGVTPDVG